MWPKGKDWFAFAGPFVVLMVYAITAEGMLDTGDAIAHFQIARFAPEMPSLFLDHWGKPLFTLVGAPLAQMGFKGLVAMNIVLCSFSALLTYLIANFFGLRGKWLLPMWIAFTPIYFKVILSGLTEILFSTLLLWCIWLVLNRRYIFGAMVLSLLPFSRPEAWMILPVFIAYYGVEKQWKKLPWMLTAFVVYGAIGAWMHGNPIWMFTQSPYDISDSIYGSGSAWHFLNSHKGILGNPLSFLYLIGLVVWLWQAIRNADAARNSSFLLLIIAPFLVCLIGHSLLWKFGIFGSAGLIRVMATVTPLTTLVALHAIQFLVKEGAPSFFHLVTGFLTLLVVQIPIDKTAFPIPKSGDEKAIEALVENHESIRQSEKHLVSMHPYTAYYLDVNPFDTQRFTHMWSLDRARADLALTQPSLIIWDSHFGPQEGKTPFLLLENSVYAKEIGREQAGDFSVVAFDFDIRK